MADAAWPSASMNSSSLVDECESVFALFDIF